ncbi:MAG: prepilin-type N-terminal cleavage/methylation domain-containing protein [Desulfobacterales bacterium]
MGNRITAESLPREMPRRSTGGGQDGFTLIELVVVMSLLALMLYVAIPRLQNDLLTDGTLRVARRIIAQVRTLQEEAVRVQATFSLHLDLTANRMWVTDERMDTAQQDAAAEAAYRLPRGVSLMAVAYPDGNRQTIGVAQIRFYPQEVSDMALIHISDEGGREFSFRIEPFLAGVKLFPERVAFD